MTMLASPPLVGSILTPERLLGMDGLFELVDGQLIEKKMSHLAGRTAGIVAALLVPFARKNGLGDIDVETSFRCFPNNPNQVRRPDLAFIAAARAAKILEEGHISIAPDLAIEIVSPEDSVYQLDDKLIDYRAAGIPLIWIINPHARTVKVHRPGQPIVELGEADQLTGDSILPDFSTPVSELLPPVVNKA